MMISLIIATLFSGCGTSSPDINGWPDTRNMHAAAYVPSSGEMLIFGGTSAKGETASLWSYREGKWTLLSENGPEPREDALMIHNTEDRNTYLIGGRNNATRVTYTDFWKWNGSQWVLLSPTLPLAPLTHASGCYDPKNKRLLVFGGVRGNSLVNELWSWDGTSWTSVTSLPPARLSSSLVYSEENQVVYLFGGALQNGTILQDVWQLDNISWTKVNESFPPVMNSSYGVAAYGKKFLLFGGFFADRQQSSDTWLFDPDLNSWTKVTGPGPTKRALHSLVYDVQSGAVLMFGGGSSGTLLDELWKFSGGAWAKIAR